jgi:hypothetical protein
MSSYSHVCYVEHALVASVGFMFSVACVATALFH